MKLSKTIQRRVILEELRKHPVHPTAEELYRAVHKRLPKISLGTVYRNLNLMAGAGLLARVGNSGSGTRYDGNPDPHPHLCCEHCGAVEDFSVEPALFQSLERHLIACLDGRAVRYYLEFRGLCRRCQLELAEEDAEKNAGEKKFRLVRE